MCKYEVSKSFTKYLGGGSYVTYFRIGVTSSIGASSRVLSQYVIFIEDAVDNKVNRILFFLDIISRMPVHCRVSAYKD